MRSWRRKVLLTLLLIFVAAQFVQPPRSNPPVDPSRALAAHVQVTPEAQAVLKRACVDCHSNETRWPWYSYVAPVSWWLVDHVNHGRSHMNMSDWAQDGKVRTPKQSAQKLDEICGEVTEGLMPLPSYLWMHRNARLSQADVRTLCDWVAAEQKRLLPD